MDLLDVLAVGYLHGSVGCVGFWPTSRICWLCSLLANFTDIRDEHLNVLFREVCNRAKLSDTGRAIGYR